MEEPLREFQRFGSQNVELRGPEPDPITQVSSNGCLSVLHTRGDLGEEHIAVGEGRVTPRNLLDRTILRADNLTEHLIHGRHRHERNRRARLERGSRTRIQFLDAAAEQQLFERLAKGFAALDGYDVWLRSIETKEHPTENDQKPVLSWVVPVRVWAKLDAWGTDPNTKQEINRPTHDDAGLARTDYMAWLRDSLKVFDTDGTVREESGDRLDPACIEASDSGLAAMRSAMVLTASV